MENFISFIMIVIDFRAVRGNFFDLTESNMVSEFLTSFIHSHSESTLVQEIRVSGFLIGFSRVRIKSLRLFTVESLGTPSVKR